MLSGHVLTELAHTFAAPYFGLRLTADEIADIFALLQDQAITVTLTTNVSGVATHSEDDLILATALSAQADYLVTGDEKLRKLATFRGVVIVSPREFLQVLKADPPEGEGFGGGVRIA